MVVLASHSKTVPCVGRRDLPENEERKKKLLIRAVNLTTNDKKDKNDKVKKRSQNISTRILRKNNKKIDFF